MTVPEDTCLDRRGAMALAVGGALLALGPGISRAQQRSTAKPKLPPGRAANGVPVALLGAGVDYVRPEISSRLFRDGEGEAVAWDAIDSDLQPLERPPEPGRPAPPVAAGTDLALMLLSEALNASLIPVRIPASDLPGFAGGLMFTARTPAAIVVALGTGLLRDPNGPLPSFARAARHALVIVPAGTGAGPAAPSKLPSAPGNLISVTACDSEGRIPEGLEISAASADLAVPVGTSDPARLTNEAAVRLAGLAVRLLGDGERIAGAELRSRILAHTRPHPQGAAARTGAGWIPDASRIGIRNR